MRETTVKTKGAVVVAEYTEFATDAHVAKSYKKMLDKFNSECMAFPNEVTFHMLFVY